MVGMSFFQAGGLCFPPGSLSTNVNPSVNYAQLVSLLLLSHLLTLIFVDFDVFWFCFFCSVPLAEVQHPVCLVRQKPVRLVSGLPCNSNFLYLTSQEASVWCVLCSEIVAHDSCAIALANILCVCQLLCINKLCGYRSSPTWRRARLSGTCAWWTCTPSAACPPTPAVSLTPSSDLGLLWAQLKTFPTGKQHYHGIYVYYRFHSSIL